MLNQRALKRCTGFRVMQTFVQLLLLLLRLRPSFLVSLRFAGAQTGDFNESHIA